MNRWRHRVHTKALPFSVLPLQMVQKSLRLIARQSPFHLLRRHLGGPLAVRPVPLGETNATGGRSDIDQRWTLVAERLGRLIIAAFAQPADTVVPLVDT
jgi:hypothetical protein